MICTFLMVSPCRSCYFAELILCTPFLRICGVVRRLILTPSCHFPEIIGSMSKTIQALAKACMFCVKVRNYYKNILII